MIKAITDTNKLKQVIICEEHPNQSEYRRAVLFPRIPSHSLRLKKNNFTNNVLLNIRKNFIFKSET